MSRRAVVDIQLSVRIPLRDGVTLSAIAYLPQDLERPQPALCTLTPYIAQTHHEQAMYFASHGYPFLSVDVRGRGESDGEFRPIFNDARDGCDVVEWIARQPYCNGKVAMWGGSYMGYTQWAAAKEHPPHLATIVPVAAPFRGGDSPLRTNIFVPYSMQWLSLVWGRTSHEKVFGDQVFWRGTFERWFRAGRPFRQLDTFLGNPSSVFQEWLEHPHRDAFWDQGNPSPEAYAQLDMPVLTITGVYDGNQTGALLHYRHQLQYGSAAARARHYLVIGPWDHAGTRIPKSEFAGLKFGPDSLIDLQQLHLDWYAWTLEDGPKPGFLQKNVAYYVLGAEQWRYADTLEEVTARVLPLRLQSTANPTDVREVGLLTVDAPTDSRPDQFVYDPRDVSLASVESGVDPDDKTDQRMMHAAAGKLLIYESERFSEDCEVSGFFRFCAWIAIDQPDTDFRVTIYEVGTNGASMQLSSDWMRARHREDLYREKLIDTTDPLLYDFDRFTFVSRRVPRGHCLRLVVGPINSIHVQRQFNSARPVADQSIDDAQPVTVRLFHDAAHPSTLYVPLGQPER